MDYQIASHPHGRGSTTRYLKLLLALLAGVLVCTNAGAAPGGHGGGFHGGHGGPGFHGGAGFRGGGHFRGHSHVGVYFGAPLYWEPYGRGWYDDPWAYPARPIVLRTVPPPVYIERGPAVPQWYFCSQPQGYYPYVQACSTAWRTVPAQPPVQ